MTSYRKSMAYSWVPIRRRLVFAAAAPIGVCAVCTFLTLTTTTKIRNCLAFSSPPSFRRHNFNGRNTFKFKPFEPLFSRYDYTSDADDSYNNNRGQQQRQRRGRYSGNSAENDGDGVGVERRRRRSGGGRSYSDEEYDSYGAGSYGRNRNGNDNGNDYYPEKGRNRYSSDGRKRQRGGRGGRGRGRNPRQQPRHQQQQLGERERPPTPPLDSRPTYFTCRHTYETSLRQELVRSLQASNLDRDKVSFQKPHPGLVMVTTQDEAIASFLSGLRPTYALQVMPNGLVVQAESIKGLAQEIVQGLLSVPGEEATGLLRSELVAAPRGSLAIHSLVPEMGRGMPESQLPQYRRVTKIGQELEAQLKKRCKAARAENPSDATPEEEEERWLLQILLLEPQVAVASFARCGLLQDPQTPPTHQKQQGLPNWTWPNWHLPAGLALVDIDDEQNRLVPSSAYRKLLEAFWYLGERPLPASESEHPVVDLGACPGGWTGVLRLMGCQVLAVDRSPLASSLMEDDGVEYVQGDAFRFVPPWVDTSNQRFEEPLSNTWMVSDIIAYPDKITELLDDWCGKHWVSHAIVTIKFQSEIPWEDMDKATSIVEGHGYSCRTVHFFNNKNEVTLLAVKHGYSTPSSTRRNQPQQQLLGKPMYSSILPKPKSN